MKLRHIYPVTSTDLSKATRFFCADETSPLLKFVRFFLAEKANARSVLPKVYLRFPRDSSILCHPVCLTPLTKRKDEAPPRYLHVSLKAKECSFFKAALPSREEILEEQRCLIDRLSTCHLKTSAVTGTRL